MIELIHILLIFLCGFALYFTFSLKLHCPIVECPSLTCPPIICPSNNNPIKNDQVHDMRVLIDPLMAPTNRTHSENYNRFNIMQNRDNFRLLGYLTSDETETWKIFGRNKDRNRGEFYISPINTQQDVKISLTDDIVKGDRLIDVENIPTEIIVSSPILSNKFITFTFIELPKENLYLQ